MADEKQLICKARAGDEKAYEAIFKRYGGLVKSISKRYYITGASAEDVEQEGRIGLFLAIGYYDEEKNDSFSSFASMCIKNRIIGAIKKNTRQKDIPDGKFLSLNRPINDNNGLTVEDVIDDGKPNPEEEVINIEERQRFKIKIDNVLSALEKDVLYQYLDGKSYDEISKSMNITKKSVDNALQRIKNKLK